MCHFPLVNVREWLSADLLPGSGMVPATACHAGNRPVGPAMLPGSLAALLWVQTDGQKSWLDVLARLSRPEWQNFSLDRCDHTS